MKVIATTDKMVVVDLEAERNPPHNLLGFDRYITEPTLIRIYSDHIELDTVNILKQDGGMRKKTKKIWFHDMLIMDEALFRINHPKIH